MAARRRAELGGSPGGEVACCPSVFCGGLGLLRPEAPARTVCTMFLPRKSTGVDGGLSNRVETSSILVRGA